MGEEFRSGFVRGFLLRDLHSPSWDSVKKSARLLQSSESSFRAEAICKKSQCLAGYWKEVRVLCHVDLSTGLPVYTWQLVFLRVRKQEGCHNAFFDLASEVTHYHTAIFLCLVRESQGEELSSISCKQFTDKAHVTRSHKRILNIPSYLRFTNSISKQDKPWKCPVFESSHPWSGPLGLL